MNLSKYIYKFFNQYLPGIRGVNECTIKSYRDTFKLFLPYAAQYRSIKIESLKIKHISLDLIIAFLNHLEIDRSNIARTRNQRLAALKSMAKMIRIIYPDHRDIADRILNIPSKRCQKNLIGYMTQEETLNIFESVDIKKKEGFRDYTILHLLFNSGTRASELASLKLDYIDYQKMTLNIVGKGHRYRQILLWPKTVELIKKYITEYRVAPKPLYRDSMFLNQRGERLTRHGIYRICEKYLLKTFDSKRLKYLNPVHSFRHSCAVNMLALGFSITEIKNHLGHEDIQSTMIYLSLNIPQKREVQKKFLQYIQSTLINDPAIDKLVDWENKADTLAYLDSL